MSSPCLTTEDLHAAAEAPSPAHAQHLSGCEACRSAVEQIRADNALAAELAGAAARPPIPSRSIPATVVLRGHDRGEIEALPAGTRIGRYTIVSLLGVGGMGMVYRAEQDAPRRPVALKLIRPELASPSVMRRFEHEAAALALLKHPGIAQVYEAGMAAASGPGAPAHPIPYFAMEFVDGKRLDHYVKQHAPPLERSAVLGLVAALCDAADHAHRRGVVHRDLKPANVLVESDGAAFRPRILDFGVAKLTAEAPSADSTQPGGFVGTLTYAAPEQVGSDPTAIDARADVFALGLILYELLVGERAYSLEAGSFNTVVQAVAQARIRSPAARGVRLDAELSTVLSTALAADPDRRYQSAAALAEDLRRYLDKRPLRARPDSTLYTLRRAVSRHPYRAAAAAGFALFAMASVGVALTLQIRAARAASVKAGVTGAFLDTLTSADQDSDDTGKLVSIDELFDAFAENIRSNLARHPDAKAELLHKLGRAMLSHRKLDAAIGVLEDVAAHFRAAGEELALAAVEHDLGRACYFRGRHEDACAHLTEALAIRERLLPPGDRDTVDSRYWLGVAHMGRRRLDEAETYVRRALEEERARRPDSPQVAEHLTSLAAIVRFRGDFEGALKLAQDSLAAIEKAKGPDHKHVAVALTNIVANLNNLGRYRDAEPLIERALGIREKWYGADDPRNADTLVSIVSLKMRLGGFVGEPGSPPEQAELLAEAADKAERALAMRRRVHPGDHDQIAEILSLLGQVRLRQQRYDEALPPLTEALAIRRRLHGDANADVGRSESVLGDCLRRAGRASEAEPLLRAGLDKVRAGYGENHRFTEEARKRLELLP